MFDPAMGTTYVTAIWGNVANGLVKTQYPEMKIVADLAERWEQPDNKTYIFHLRRGIKFHNVEPVKGRELTSQDVKTSLQYYAEDKPTNVRRSQFGQIASIETPDNYTVKVTLLEPFAAFLTYLALPQSAVFAKEMVDKYGDLRRPEAAVATGPFIFESWTPGTELVLKRNPDYWENDLPYVDLVKIPIMTDAAARISALRSKQADLTSNIPPGEEESLKQVAGMTILASGQLHWNAILVNQTVKPYDDVRVRKAISLALDRDEIMEGTFGKGHNLVQGPLSPVVRDYLIPEEELRALPGYRKPKEQDIAQAKRLLAEAGYPNGFKTKNMTTMIYQTTYIKPAEIVKPQLAKVGIDVEFDVMEWGTLKKRERERDFEMVIGQWMPVNDPDDQLYSFNHSRGSNNISGFADPEIDKLLEEQRTVVDAGKRKAVVLEVQRKLLDKLPWIWIGSPKGTVAYWSWVKNVVPHEPNFFFGMLRNMWLDK